jgi:hypothetical protein
MKKFVLFICGLLLSGGLYAQNSEGATDDIGRIALTPVILDEAGIPSYARQVLSTKLKDIATRNGMSSASASPRFVITASTTLVNKEMTATAPPMVAVELMTTLYIGDAITGQLFATHQYNTVKGLGTNDQRAYLAAFKHLSSNSAELDAFVAKGKERIVEYYNSQIDFLLTEAKSLAEQEKYDESLSLLASVPNVCKDAYNKAMAQISVVYQKKIDAEGAKYFNQANAAWNSNKTKEGAQACVELLAKINPLSSSAESGNNLVKKIEEHYAELTAYHRQIAERNWNYKVQVETEQREMQREQMKLNHELAMRQSDNYVRANQMALQEARRTTQMFLNARSRSSLFVTSVSARVRAWFR